jgi:GcrA cell cycle regulator
MSWNDERVDTLKKLWAAGISGTQIAAQLGGTTRNACIAKLHRLGVTRRDPSAPRTRLPKPAPKPRLVIHAPTPQPVLQPEDIARIATVNLEPHHCRWACGDPAIVGSFEPLFCGSTKLPGLPYCEMHAARAYATPVPRAAPAPAREVETAS